MPNSESCMIRLEDGRQLGYAEYGALNGKPLFFFHGYPGSRLEGRLFNDAAGEQGIRVIAIDRPGFGLSDLKVNRTIAEWPKDVIELADYLGIDSFAVMGISGGGPYVAACASYMPNRLTKGIIVGGMAPLDVKGITRGMKKGNRVLFSVADKMPWLVNIAMQQTEKLSRTNPERLIIQLIREAPKPDKDLLINNSRIAEVFLEIKEAFRSGTDGATLEAKLYSRPWGFPLEKIDCDIRIWQGGDDVNVPLVMGHYLADTIPNAKGYFFGNEGHLSLLVNHMEEILQDI